MLHNAQVQQVKTQEISADEMWSCREKTENLPTKGVEGGGLLDLAEFSRQNRAAIWQRGWVSESMPSGKNWWSLQTDELPVLAD